MFTREEQMRPFVDNMSARGTIIFALVNRFNIIDDVKKYLSAFIFKIYNQEMETRSINSQYNRILRATDLYDRIFIYISSGLSPDNIIGTVETTFIKVGDNIDVINKYGGKSSLTFDQFKPIARNYAMNYIRAGFARHPVFIVFSIVI